MNHPAFLMAPTAEFIEREALATRALLIERGHFWKCPLTGKFLGHADEVVTCKAFYYMNLQGESCIAVAPLAILPTEHTSNFETACFKAWDCVMTSEVIGNVRDFAFTLHECALETQKYSQYEYGPVSGWLPARMSPAACQELSKCMYPSTCKCYRPSQAQLEGVVK